MDKYKKYKIKNCTYEKWKEISSTFDMEYIQMFDNNDWYILLNFDSDQWEEMFHSGIIYFNPDSDDK